VATILDLHSHSEASEDSRAPLEAYLNWIKLRHQERPVDGIVLTEHRQFNASPDYRALEDKFGLMVLKASEVETDYGHVLVFGVTDEMTRRFDALMDGGFPYLAALLEGSVVGYAYAGPYRPRPAYRFTVENSVYLEPAIHRRGIGLQLLQHLITECETRGFRQMIAVIGDSANAGSIGVHARCGFQMIGTHPSVGLKFGRWLDTVMMQLPLGEGATTVPTA